MNRKQRVLTIWALIAFVVIGAAHYIEHDVQELAAGSIITVLRPYIEDVRMPFFMLGVIYVGLFFLLADKKEKK